MEVNLLSVMQMSSGEIHHFLEILLLILHEGEPGPPLCWRMGIVESDAMIGECKDLSVYSFTPKL